MSRPVREAKGKVTPSAPSEKKGGSRLMSIALAIWALLGPIAGALVNDYFDVLKSNREVSKQYAESASKYSQEVDKQIAALVTKLGQSDSIFSENDKTNLRRSLVDLQRSTEKLSFRVGVSEQVLEAFSKSMADLADAADEATGPGDAKPLVQAIVKFSVAQRNFELDVARNYSPGLFISWES